jgi:hypothetical protein
MSKSENGDLTGIIDYAKKLKESGDSNPSSPSESEGLPPGVEDRPIEKIDHFESLDELPQAPEVSDPFATNEPSPESDPGDVAGESQFQLSELPLEEALPTSTSHSFAETSSHETLELPPAPLLEPFESEDLTPQELDLPLPPPAAVALTPDPTHDTHTALLAHPHHIVIRGTLAANELERLSDLLKENGLPLSPEELVAQSAQGCILIPEVSEYLAVLMAGALRDSTAELTAIPSALWRGFSAHFPSASSDNPQPLAESSSDPDFSAFSEDLDSTGFSTPESSISTEEVTLVASARFRPPLLENESLSEKDRARALDDLIERLIDQVRHKAKYRNAKRIGEVKTEIHSSGPGEPDRILVTLQAWIEKS